MIGQEGLRGWLRDVGDKMSEAEVRSGSCEVVLVLTSRQLDRFFKGPFTDRQGKFDYVKFAKTLKVNDADEVEQQQQNKG
jgi:myosin regulatory light chain 12